MNALRLLWHLSWVWIFCSALALAAHAGPDLEGSVDVEVPSGLPGLCDQPCYRVTKSFEYWLPDNPDNPLPLSGNNTYIYKISHTGGTGTPLGFIPAVTGFEIEADPAFVTDAGFIGTSPGVAPSSTTVDTTFGVVSWEFLVDPIESLEASKLLYIHSPLLPGTVADSMVSFNSQVSLAAQGSSVGPFVEAVSQCNLQVGVEGCVVQPPDVVGDACQGKVTAMTLEYTGLGCDASSNLQNPRKTACYGGANGESPVDIMVSGKTRRRWSWGWGWWGKKHRRKTVFAAESNVAVGDLIEVEASHANQRKLGPKVNVKIVAAGGGEVIEFDRFHTSCSQPLGPGMTFGSLRVVSLTSTEGGTVTLPEDEDDECITSIDTVPAPHCEGKVMTLQLRYVGGDCNQTMNTQAASKVGCTDVAPPSALPVRVVISDGSAPPPHSSIYQDETGISGGDILTVRPSQCGRDWLTPATGFWIHDAVTDDLIQAGYFHTSCSQPLNLGDRFGALQVFGMHTTEGGDVALGQDVEYTYVVSNPNDDGVDNVALDDDVYGEIAAGLSLAPGESQRVTLTALVEAETTNVVTATGDVAGLSCEPATGEATVTVSEPPAEPQICTKKIAAMLLEYTGPEVVDATVEFKAKAFRNEPVVYAGVHLVPGTVLSMPTENGFTIDGTAHGESSLGSKVTVTLDGEEEVIHTSCSVPFASDAPAPLHDPAGEPSALWTVVDFTEKHRPGKH